MSIETAARKAAHVWTRCRTTNKVGLSLKVTLDALVSAVEAADAQPKAEPEPALKKEPDPWCGMSCAHWKPLRYMCGRGIIVRRPARCNAWERRPDATPQHAPAPFGHVIESVHNFIGDDDIIRKGAISAYAGEAVIIPWNMRDGTILGCGKGNPEWNFSAPHGAGRKMARGRAKRELSLDEFKATMTGVWSSCVTKDTLDESPMAYKDSATIRDAIGDTVEIVHTLKPVYNFKAGAE